MMIASNKKRLLALFIDYLIILGFALFLLGCNLLIYFFVFNGIPDFNEFETNLVSLTLLLPVVLYSILSEAGKKKGTLGKRVMKLEVASATSKPLKPWQLIIRNIIKFAPWEFAHIVILHLIAAELMTPFWTVMLIVTYILPLLWLSLVIFKKDHRGLHDMIAKTIVICKLKI